VFLIEGYIIEILPAVHNSYIQATQFQKHNPQDTNSNTYTYPLIYLSALRANITMAGLLGNLTNSLDNTLTGGDKEQGQGGLLGSVGGTVNKTVDGAGNVVGQTTDGLGNTVGQTTNGVADTAGQTTQGVGKTVGGVTDQAGGTLGGVTGQK
jgi:hypothetical protein